MMTALQPASLRTVLLTSLLAAGAGVATGAERARDLGIRVPGPLNGITDVSGGGDSTVVSGAGTGSRPGSRAHRHHRYSSQGQTVPKVYGGWFTLNASGEMTGQPGLRSGMD